MVYRQEKKFRNLFYQLLTDLDFMGIQKEETGFSGKNPVSVMIGIWYLKSED